MRFIYRVLFFVFTLTASATSHAMLTASPSFVDFGSVTVNSTSFSQSIFVNNSSGTAANGIMVENGCNFDFQVENLCMGTLQAYSSCEIEISFHPSSTGMQTCSLQITSTEGDFVSIEVQGTGD